jgi:hypothetical protein
MKNIKPLPIIILFSVIIIGLSIAYLPSYLKNRELNGVYYYYFKGKYDLNFKQLTEYSGAYTFSNGKITNSNSKEEEEKFEVIDKDNVDIIFKSVGGTIQRNRWQITRDANDKVISLNRRSESITGNDLDVMYLKE